MPLNPAFRRRRYDASSKSQLPLAGQSPVRLTIVVRVGFEGGGFTLYRALTSTGSYEYFTEFDRGMLYEMIESLDGEPLRGSPVRQSNRVATLVLRGAGWQQVVHARPANSSVTGEPARGRQSTDGSQAIVSFDRCMPPDRVSRLCDSTGSPPRSYLASPVASARLQQFLNFFPLRQ